MTDLPPYTYIPGKTPHPISDPKGHSYQRECEPILSLDEHFEIGLTLFNHGFYWEAHEAWEEVWIKLGRRGTQADFVKGLIKLAACGVKCLEGNEAGAQRHLARSIQLIKPAIESDHIANTFGIDTPKLFETLENLRARLPDTSPPDEIFRVQPILGRIGVTNT